MLRAHAYYMHDDHTFSRLRGNIAEIVRLARMMGRESPYGMLCPLYLVNDRGQDHRRVGKSAHARADGIDETALEAWRIAVTDDPTACWLLEENLASED